MSGTPRLPAAEADRRLRISSRHPLSTLKTLAQPKQFLDHEEDEWNKSDAFSRSKAGRGALTGAARRPAAKEGGIVPIALEDDEDYEWISPSWAREKEQIERGGGGGWQRSKKDKGGDSRKQGETEADMILRKVAQGIKVDMPGWEGGGKVEQASERRRKSGERKPWERMGKGSWNRSARRQR